MKPILFFLTSVLCSLTSVFGQTGTIHVDQDMTGHKLLNVGTPTLNGDAANKLYVDTHGGGGGGSGTVTSITATAPIIVTPSPLTTTGVISIDGDLVSLAAATGTNTIYYRSAADTWSPVTIGGNMTFTGGTLDASTSALSTNIVSDTAYNATTWDGDTTHAPSKNAVRDKFESLAGGNLSTTGSPLDNQVAVFTDGTHVEGNSNLSFDSTTNILSSVIMSPTTGFRINGAAANRRILVGNATNFVQSTETYAVPGASGNVMQSDGTNWTSAQLGFSALSGNWTLAQGPSTTASKLIGRTDASAGIPQEITLGTNLSITGTTLNATGGGSIASTTDILKGNGSGGAVALGSATTGKVLKSNGTTFVASTETYAAPGTTGNVLTSDGTNWTSAAPVGGSPSAPETLTLSDAATSTLTDLLTVSHNSSNTPLADFGTAIHFKGKSSTTNDRDLAQISAAWDSATDASRTAHVDIAPYALTNASTRLRVYNSGYVTNGTQADAGGMYINSVGGFRAAQITPTNGWFLQSDAVSYKNSGYALPLTVGTAGYTMRSDGTNMASYPQDVLNSSTASDTSFSNADRYLIGSNVVVAAGDFKAKGQYRCIFDMTKSAGTGAITISVRAGVNGSTADTAQLTFNTFPAGTSVADTGTFEVIVTWRSVGSGTSAVLQGVCRAQKNTITAAGLWGDTSAAKTIVATTSSGFASNTMTNIGLSFNGNTAFAGTVTLVQASLLQ